MLYCSVIVHTRSIASLRDLGPQHLPLLRNIRQQSEAAVIRAFGLKKGELRMFVHYQPSFCALPVPASRCRLGLTMPARPPPLISIAWQITFMCTSWACLSPLDLHFGDAADSASTQRFRSQVHVSCHGYSGVSRILSTLKLLTIN